jgi:hypothetical protein
MYRKIQEERARIINKIIAEGGSRSPDGSERKTSTSINNQFIYTDEEVSDYSETNYDK